MSDWRDPVAMDIDEFYCEYIAIPTTDDEDGQEIVLIGATMEIAREIVAAVNAARAAAGSEKGETT